MLRFCWLCSSVSCWTIRTEWQNETSANQSFSHGKASSPFVLQYILQYNYKIYMHHLLIQIHQIFGMLLSMCYSNFTTFYPQYILAKAATKKLDWAHLSVSSCCFKPICKSFLPQRRGPTLTILHNLLPPQLKATSVNLRLQGWAVDTYLLVSAKITLIFSSHECFTAWIHKQPLDLLIQSQHL